MFSIGAAALFLLSLPAASGFREALVDLEGLSVLGVQDWTSTTSRLQDAVPPESPKAQVPPPGGGGSSTELLGLRRELEETKEELAELKQHQAQEREKLDEAFEQHAGKRLLYWNRDQVFAFFAQNGQTEVGQRMREEHVDGAKFFDILQDYDSERAARYGLANRSALEAAKLDVWNYLAAQEAPPQDRGLSTEQKSAKDKCDVFCDTFEVEYVFGYEWVLFPPAFPWPNPIHTFACNPVVWKEFESVKTQVFGSNGTDAMFQKVAKDLGNWLVDLLGTISANIVNALFTMGKCALCGLCIVWQGLADRLEKVSRKIAEAKSYLLVTASTEQKNAAWDRFNEGFKSSLVDVFKMHEDGGAAAEVWRRRAREERERGRLYTDEEIEERMAQVERQQQLALEALTAAREASYERAGKQLREVWKPKLERAATYAHGGQGRAAAAEASGGSRAEVDWGAPNASSLAETQWEAKGLMIPDECNDVLDPKKNLRAFRDAFQVALNIEEPKLGDALTKVTTLDFRGAAEALIPEILVMLTPVKKELGVCLEAPEKLREAQACSCTNRHKGMCVMSMKYRLLSNMIRQEWPPLSPTWRQRWTVSAALDRSVLHTCLGEDQVLGGLRSKAKRYSESVKQNLTAEEEKANLDYQDCRYISKRVQEWDTAEDGSPKYGPLIWFAAMQVWAQEANGSKSDVRLNAGPTEPDADPFLHQFCDAVLECEGKTGRQDKVFEWRNFVESFGKNSATKSNKKESALAKMKNAVRRDRTLMHRHWAKHARSFKKAFYPEEVLEALQRMQEAYIDKVKPLMTEMLDLRTDFLSPPSPFKPQLARMISDGIYPPFERLENPEVMTNKEWAKLQLDFNYAVDVYVWLEVKEDAGYAELHSVLTCEEDCGKCRFVGAKGEITPEWLATRDRRLQGCKGSTSWTGAGTTPAGSKKKCKACLKKKPRVVEIVDCNRMPDNEFYSLNHPAQASTQNKYAIVHTYWPRLAKYSKAQMLGFESPFKRTYIHFAGKSGYQRRVLQSELFATIRDAGKCFCLCEKLRDYTAGASCHKVIKPNMRYLDGLQDTQWCLPDDSELPSAVCSTKKVATVLESRLNLLPVARGQISCFHGLSFRNSAGECMRRGLRLVTGKGAARLLTALKKAKNWNPLHAQIEELEAKNFGNLSKEDVTLTKAFKTCLDLASAAQPSGNGKIVGLGRGRVWATEGGAGRADMEKAMLNGEFAYRMQDCLKK